MLGMLELQYDADDRVRQITTAAQAAAGNGGLRLDSLTALQVREHAHLDPTELKQALREAAPRGLAARRAMPEQMQKTPYDPELPGEKPWTYGYLFDIIHTRDPWLHRIDICRAVGRSPALTADHDGRLIADVVTDWAPRHGQGFALTLTGPAAAPSQQATARLHSSSTPSSSAGSSPAGAKGPACSRPAWSSDN
jgi:hypothetical protein